MKISKTDYSLIMALQEDGSLSYSELGNNLGITAKTAAKRVERLLSTQVISIRAQPNPYKLGLSASAMLAIKADPSKIESICEKLAKNFHANLVQTVFGRLDILAIVYFPDWEMLHDFINNELYRLDGVTQVELYFIKEVIKRYERLFNKEKFINGQQKVKPIDWKLIKELTKNARVNTNDLAQRINIHVSTVYRRIESFLEAGIIRISAVPNPSRLMRYSANAFIILDADPSQVDIIAASLYGFSEVHFIMTLDNRSGMIVCIHARDNDSLYQFIKTNISHQKGLLKIETFIRSMVQKTYYGWWLETTES